MPRFIDLSGKRFGKLVCQRFVQGSRKQRGLWECLCDCGNTSYAVGADLKRGHSASCGCSKLRPLTLKYRTYSEYKRKAAKRGYDFTLTPEMFYSLLDKECVYCGTPPAGIVRRNGRELVYNGVDRLNNSRGYVSDNVVPCCRICNVAKATQTLDEFVLWVRKVHKHLCLEPLE